MKTLIIAFFFSIASSLSAQVSGDYRNKSTCVKRSTSFFTCEIKNFSALGSGGTATLSQSVTFTGVTTIGSGATLIIQALNIIQSETPTLAATGKNQISGSHGTLTGKNIINTFQTTGTYEALGSSQLIHLNFNNKNSKQVLTPS